MEQQILNFSFEHQEIVTHRSWMDADLTLTTEILKIFFTKKSKTSLFGLFQQIHGTSQHNFAYVVVNRPGFF